MLRAGLIGSDEGQVDIGLHHGRQFALGLLGGFLQPLQRHPVLAQIDTLVLAELVGEIVHHPLVEVFASKERIAVGRLDLEDTIADFEDRNIKRAAAKVEDGDFLVLLLIETVGERGRGRFVDDAQDAEPRDAARVLGRLPLTVVEVRGDRDNCLGHFFAEIVLGSLLHLLENERRDFRRTVFLAANLDPRRTVIVLYDFIRQNLDRLLDFRVVVTASH